MKNTGEIWKDIPGTEGIYQASSMGRVRRSLSAPKRSATYPGRLLAESTKEPYARVGIRVNKKYKKELVHRLVAMCFMQPYRKGLHINHIDGNKHNNRLENLEWVTAKQNVHHAWRTGLSRPTQGEHHGMAELADADVFAIRRAYDRGVQLTKISEVFGIGISQVSSIGRRDSWKHLKDKESAA